MTKDYDPTRYDQQRTDEVSRQRGYGEQGGAKAKPVEAQSVDGPGYKATEERPTEPDRGVFRDDGQPKPTAEGEAPKDRADMPVIDPEDARHPNAPETLNADMGAKPDVSPDDADTGPATRDALKDNYSD